MSCVVARSVSITKIRSCKVLNAGIVLGIMIGIFVLLCALLAYPNACARSAIRSALSSSPTDTRTHAGEIPADSSSLWDSWECVVEAGWITSDLASPIFALIQKSFKLSHNALAFS